MWRKLTFIVFLILLTKVVNASPISTTNHNEYSQHLSISTEHQNYSIDASEESKESYNIPRFNRINPSIFTAEIQITPNYFLEIEFFKVKLTPALFKNLTNPPVNIQWFEQLSHNTNSSRLSGWKDGNILYSSRTRYHS
jgi:hypothetical protein